MNAHSNQLNGAESLVETLLGAGIDTCFANPGTSEMHLVGALDRYSQMRCVLGLFEGVVTGAADGYARITGRPAASLLHLGPGLANGIANLHNARKAGTPMLSIIGDHATYHRQYDAPLTSDIEGLAKPVSHWLRTSTSATHLGGDVAAAVVASKIGGGAVATLIVPADVAWSSGGQPAAATAPSATVTVDEVALAQAAAMLRKDGAALFLGGSGLLEPGLTAAGRIAEKARCRLIGPTSAARARRGAGAVAVERVPYVIDRALETLGEVRHAVFCGMMEPVAFFAYPGKPSLILPPEVEKFTPVSSACEVAVFLDALADYLGACKAPSNALRLGRGDRQLGSGCITLEGLGTSISALLPDDAILVDESISASFKLLPALRHTAPHDHLQLTGGSIGMGLPLAAGAAIAAPHRKTVCLQADGSAMYTLQALWTQARERANVVTVLLANGSYATLHHEFANVGFGVPGPNATAMIDLDKPDLDWVRLGEGMGVATTKVDNLEAFNAAFAAALREDGPTLIVVPYSER
ncbi:MAG TPA: acetolactate synthase large subunit [Pseudorhizobium sp.]|nr:acetolactate synthase large subunit [Pseudorhizobium sp.]